MKAIRKAARDAVMPRPLRAPPYRAADLDRDLLGLLTASDVPLSAYDIVERLRSSKRPVVVMSIYRALNRLCQDGLTERVEMTARYRARDVQRALLLTCTECGRTTPVEATSQHVDLLEIAANKQFATAKIALEAAGICEACQIELAAN